MRLIDVDALGIDKCNPNVFENKGYADGWNSAISVLKDAPTIDAEPVRKGKWEYFPLDDTVICSNCGHEHYLGSYHQYNKNYCPNCGAKME